MLAAFFDGVTYGKLSATAGTVIRQLVRPFRGGKTCVTGFRYTPPATTTSHVLTFKMEIGRTTLALPAAAGQAVITLAGQPTAARVLATSDFLVVERVETASGYGNDTWEVYQLHSSTAPVVNSDGSITTTLAANVAGAHNAGQLAWLMSLTTDVIPGYDQTPLQINALTATLLGPTGTLAVEFPQYATMVSEAGGFISTFKPYSPVIFESNNVTTLGTLEWLAAAGLKRGGESSGGRGKGLAGTAFSSDKGGRNFDGSGTQVYQPGER